MPTTPPPVTSARSDGTAATTATDAARPPLPPLAFGPFVIDVANARLSRDGEPLELPPKSLDVLACLAGRAGELVLKDELLDAVWGRRFISEGVVKTVVSELRAVLGDDARAPRWVETVPRRGYRFIGNVRPHEGGASAGASAVASSSGSEAEATPVGNLPLPATALLGRDADRRHVLALLEQHRLVTVAGPAGIGKTRLAVDAARGLRPADGRWLVELAPLAAGSGDASTLRSLIVQVLGLAADAAGSDARLAQALVPQQLLLVLDNAEHLLPTLAPLVAALLASAPQLRILVSSQEPLRLDGEQVLRLAPLAVPPLDDDEDTARLMAHGAVRLFVERVAARLPGFALTPHHGAAVARICRTLDGLPLALELAAARVPLLGVHGLAERLAEVDADVVDASLPAGDPRFRLLTSGPRTATARQRTLHDALQWSHALLSGPQQRVLRRLAVFHGGFTLASAQAVCADAELDDWAVLDAVDALVEKSLLVAPPAESPVPRFTQLESVRAFALQRLLEAGELATLRERHLQAMVRQWEHADAHAHSDIVEPWLARHGVELDNLRAALRWATAHAEHGDDAVALVAHSAMLWSRLGLTVEGRGWCESVRAHARGTEDALLRGRFDLGLAFMAMYGNVYSPAEGLEAVERAFACEPPLDPVRRYMAAYLGYLLVLRVRSKEERLPWLAAAEGLVRPEWGEIVTRNLRFIQAYELRLQGRTEDYLAMCREEVARYRRLGARRDCWNAAWGLMLAENDSGRPEAALALGRDALAEIRAERLLRQHLVFFALWLLILAEQGDVPGTRAALAEALPLMRAGGSPWMAQLSLAWLAAHEGRDDDASRLLAWYHADGTARGENNSATLLRSSEALKQRLEARMGAEALAGQAAQGASLGDAGAAELALGPAAPQPPMHVVSGRTEIALRTESALGEALATPGTIKRPGRRKK